MAKWLILLAFALFSSPTHGYEGVVAVRGYGEIQVVPDWVRIDFYVAKRDPQSMAKAKSQLDDMSSRVASALLASGVSEQDIVSSSMSLYEDRYDFEDACVMEHVAKRDLEVLVREVDDYPIIVQALVDAGITEISHVDPEISDDGAVRRAALAKALEDARANAAFVAREMGLTLGSTRRIVQSRTEWYSRKFAQITVLGRAGGGPTTVYEFRPRPVSVEATVEVEYQIE